MYQYANTPKLHGDIKVHSLALEDMLDSSKSDGINWQAQ